MDLAPRFCCGSARPARTVDSPASVLTVLSCLSPDTPPPPPPPNTPSLSPLGASSLPFLLSLSHLSLVTPPPFHPRSLMRLFFFGGGGGGVTGAGVRSAVLHMNVLQGCARCFLCNLDVQLPVCD